ncbi:MAG TPA: LysR substrate-binding domain-containing protein [Myxococcaceae bacterium]|jgi:DNA-binding transcriptional LysR family regulator
MDLNLLSLFVTVAEAASFSAAATKLGLRRSSVSRGVASLERALRVQLFSRTTRHVALTTAGTALYAKVAPQLASLADALGTLPERKELPSGELRLTAPHDLGAVVLPAVISGFSMRYPAVQVDVRLTNQKVDLVAEGFDLALRFAGEKLSDSSLVARRLSGPELQVFAAPTYLARAGTPRTPADTADHQWIHFRAIQGLPPPLPAPRTRPSVICDDVLFMHGAVKAGLGLSVLPAYLAREDVATGKLVRVLPRLSIRAGALYFVHPPSRHLPLKVTAFRDFLIEYLAANPLFSRPE